MKTRTKALVIGGMMAALGGAAFSVAQQQGGQGGQQGVASVISQVASFQVTAVSDFETEGFGIVANHLKGLALPAGTSLESEGEVEWSYTGFTLTTTGESQVLCTLIDEIADVSYANLYLDGSLVATANRQNGLIVDRGSRAIVSIPVLVSGSGLFDLKVEWFSDTGVHRESTHTES